MIRQKTKKKYDKDGLIARSGKVNKILLDQSLDLSKSAISLKIACLFLESHPEPNKALCDGPSALPLHLLEEFLFQVKQIDLIVKKQVDLNIN